MATPGSNTTYVTGKKVDVFDVRSEIYDVINWMQLRKNDHIIAWQQAASGHPENCATCRTLDAEMQGVVHVLRAFGGKCRR